MPTAAGGQPHRQGAAGASAALVLCAAERDTSCLRERGGKEQPQRGPRHRAARPAPAPATPRRTAGRLGALPEGTERARRGAVPPQPAAQRQLPPAPQSPRRRHTAPDARLSAPPPPAHWLPAAAASGEGRHGARRGGSAEPVELLGATRCPPRRAGPAGAVRPRQRHGAAVSPWGCLLSQAVTLTQGNKQ